MVALIRSEPEGIGLLLRQEAPFTDPVFGEVGTQLMGGRELAVRERIRCDGYRRPRQRRLLLDPTQHSVGSLLVAGRFRTGSMRTLLERIKSDTRKPAVVYPVIIPFSKLALEGEVTLTTEQVRERITARNLRLADEVGFFAHLCVYGDEPKSNRTLVATGTDIDTPHGASALVATAKDGERSIYLCLANLPWGPTNDFLAFRRNWRKWADSEN